VEELYEVKLTKEEIEMLILGCQHFRMDLDKAVHQPFYVEKPEDSVQPFTENDLKNLSLRLTDLNNINSAIKKLGEVIK